MLNILHFGSLTGDLWVLLGVSRAQGRSTMWFGGQLIMIENFYFHYNGQISLKNFSKTESSTHVCTTHPHQKTGI